METVCRRCIATVATAYDEGELHIYEEQHICDPVLVERIYCMKPPSSETVEDSQNRQFTKGKP